MKQLIIILFISISFAQAQKKDSVDIITIEVNDYEQEQFDLFEKQLKELEIQVTAVRQRAEDQYKLILKRDPKSKNIQLQNIIKVLPERKKIILHVKKT